MNSFVAYFCLVHTPSRLSIQTYFDEYSHRLSTDCCCCELLDFLFFTRCLDYADSYCSCSTALLHSLVSVWPYNCNFYSYFYQKERERKAVIICWLLHMLELFTHVLVIVMQKQDSFYGSGS